MIDTAYEASGAENETLSVPHRINRQSSHSPLAQSPVARNSRGTLYQFEPNPKTWDDRCHRYPGPETRSLDRLLNDLRATKIVLSPGLVAECRRIAWLRNLKSTRRGDRNYRCSRDKSDFQIHFEAELGQAGVSVYLGIEYEGTIDTFRRADIERYNIEVRSTTQDWHGNKVRPDDDDSRRVVMAVVKPMGRVWLPGWCYAQEGKTFPIHRDPPPCHFVPISHLRPMFTLKELIGL